MKTFTRYLDAARFCREHNLSIASINKTGQWSYTVIFSSDLLVTTGKHTLPVI